MSIIDKIPGNRPACCKPHAIVSKDVPIIVFQMENLLNNSSFEIVQHLKYLTCSYR